MTSRDLPILFSGSMVRAILREIEQPGTGKTQTRRVLNPQPLSDGYYEGDVDCTFVPAPASNQSAYFRFAASAVGGGAVRTETHDPRYAIGDRLYIREAWRTESSAYDDLSPSAMGGEETVIFEADADWKLNKSVGRLRQGMHMPRWASRITLIVTDVRVQRLQEISEADAWAEGVEDCREADGGRSIPGHGRDLFQSLWDSLNASRGYGWDANPWLAAYTFRPVLGNIDEVAR